jgi:argininosuccinate lyase
VEAVNELVNKGIPFREAYQQVGNDIEKGSFHFDHTKGLHHSHEGSIGRLNNEEINQQMMAVLQKFK